MKAARLAGSAALLAWSLQAALVSAADHATASAEPQTQTATAPPAYDEDLDPVPAEPDFGVITLPTNLRLPKHKIDFRLTHRFARGLSEGSFGDLASDFFGFDGGAQIGFGLRFGLFRGNEVAVYRTSDRTIQISDQQELLHEGKSPVGLSVAGLRRGPEQLRPLLGAGGSDAPRVLAVGGARRLAPPGHEGRPLRGALVGREHAHHPVRPR